MSIAQLVSIPEFPLFGGRFRPIMSRPNALDFSLISRWRRYREYIRTVMTSHSLNVCPLLLKFSRILCIMADHNGWMEGGWWHCSNYLCVCNCVVICLFAVGAIGLFMCDLGIYMSNSLFIALI